MTRKQIYISLISVILLSLLALGSWLYEIVEIIGWYGLNWLGTPLFCPYDISLLVAIAFILPFVISKQINIKRTMLVILLLYLINLFCYFRGDNICRETYSYIFAMGFGSDETFSLKFILIEGVAIHIILGLVYSTITHFLIKKIKRLNALLLILSFLFIIPLSLLTVYCFRGLGSSSDFIDAVKMGYPAFWTTMLVGICGIIIAGKKKPNIQ